MKRFVAIIMCILMVMSMLSVNVFADDGIVAPEMPTLKTTYGVTIADPIVSSQRVLAGDTFNISFRLDENCVNTWVDSLGEPWYGNGYLGSGGWDGSASVNATVSGNGFTLAGALAEQDLYRGSNMITVLSDPSLKSGRYQVVLTVTCRPKNGAAVSDSRTFNIDVEASSVDIDESNEKPDVANFSLSSASIPEGKGKSKLSTEVTMKFKNDSTVAAKDVTVTLSNMGELILDTYTDTVKVGDVKAGGSFSAAFPIKFPEYPSAQTSFVATLKYKDDNNNEYSQSINVYLQAREKEKKEEVPGVLAALTPKVIVSNYETDVEKIISGDEFVLTFVLKNTSLDKDVKNMTVDVIPGTDGSANSTSGTIFSPIDGTTSFYTKQLDKDGELEYSIKLKTSASAGARSYPITIRYEFEYEVGSSYSNGNGSMDINLPVTQPIKFELMEWYPPTECSANGTMINFQYFNKSKNPMTNLAVSVEGDFTMPTQYVGTLNASSYDFFNGSIMPNDPGAIGETKQAILVFTFEDASSNEQRVEYPFDVTITEAMGGMGDMFGGDFMEDPMFGDDMMFPDDPNMAVPANGDGAEGGMANWLKYTLFIGIPVVVVIIVIVVAVVIKKRKARLYEEEDDE